jgi:hypothetical protein
MNISQDFIDYIQESGYNLYRSAQARHFNNNGKHLLIYDDGDMHYNIDGKMVCIYRNVNKMSMFTFALLLHAIGAVDMKENFRKVKTGEVAI